MTTKKRSFLVIGSLVVAFSLGALLGHETRPELPELLLDFAPCRVEALAAPNPPTKFVELAEAYAATTGAEFEYAEEGNYIAGVMTTCRADEMEHE